MKPGNLTEVEPSAATMRRPAPLPPAGMCLVAVVSVAALLLVHLTTVIGIVGTWSHSVTYNHGFLVLPVSAWLLWRDRARLSDVQWRPWWPGLIGLALLGLLWFAGYAANIKSFRDLSLVASIPAMLVTVLGKDFGRRAAFPLAFILFAWPFGEVFIPNLIDLTADFTVAALRLSGVPVFREGNNFVIPSGSWSVVQECSGVRYLLVSLFAGCLFGFLNFRSNRRRWMFVGLAVVVPIIANWLRAYGIVLLGHLSNNEIAVGVDHLIYGWVFFGLVMTGLFYFGLRFMGDTVPATRATLPLASGVLSEPAKPRSAWIIAAAGIGIVAIAPAAAAQLDRAATSSGTGHAFALPDHLGPWSSTTVQSTGWKPPFENPTAHDETIYGQGTDLVEAFVARYATDTGESKLTTFEGNTMVDFDSAWHMQWRRDIRVPAVAPDFQVIEREIRARGRSVLVWQWALVGGTETSGFVGAKLALVRSRLAGRGSASTGVALVAPIENEDVARARSNLQDFAQRLRPVLASGGTR
ncbi:MAG: exosortase A [Betaproteobacteria bacterium]